MQANLLQSDAWLDFQSQNHKPTFHIKEKDFEFFAYAEPTRLGSYLFIPYGPILTGKSPKTSLKNALKSIKTLCTENHFIFARLEPRTYFDETFLKSLHLKKSHDLNPADTWLLDLTGDDSEFKHRLPSRLLRYYKKLSKNHLEIITSKNPNDIHYLLNLQKSLAREKHISTYSEDYYRIQLAQPFSTLYLLRSTDNKENVLAAGLVFDYIAENPEKTIVENSGKTTSETPSLKIRYNLQGAQSPEGRPLHATGLLTLRLIFDAREKGLDTFDFWGIAPENAKSSHPWAGFTTFKKSFKGTESHFSGTYDLPVSKKYPLYLLLRTLNRIKRKILS